MHKPQQQVQDFHRAISQPVSPAPPELRDAELRSKLILEEALETVVALVGMSKALKLTTAAMKVVPRRAKPDLVEVIDGLCDLIFVAYGTAEVIGIDLEPFYDSVSAANLAKVGGERRADGKALKPEGWKPPDIAGILALVTP